MVAIDLPRHRAEKPEVVSHRLQHVSESFKPGIGTEMALTLMS